MIKMKMKMKHRSHRYDINKPIPRHGHKYSKCKKRFSMMKVPHRIQTQNESGQEYERQKNDQEGNFLCSIKKIRLCNIRKSE